LTVLDIFTDGACRGNPGPGAWAAIIRDAHGVESCLSGYCGETTNNRMEMMAAIEALSAVGQSSRVRLFTDSQYLQKGMQSWVAGWKRRGWKTSAGAAVKNQDLWIRLDELSQMHEISWHWVRGHSGHPENERVDQMAQSLLDESC